ncbi:hypothetical protein HanXRQr2_Chr04g0140841 [Helianthus annuus]|uniref:Uncharacterized protein n=1 Tax=Helianthus annuus TaxID=4232 RepID=A0A9K3J434_HELAN|nr:hypothetical protein HanXRQr2_Chr04g0140841 [Helianthus annuus]
MTAGSIVISSQSSIASGGLGVRKTVAVVLVFVFVFAGRRFLGHLALLHHHVKINQELSSRNVFVQREEYRTHQVTYFFGDRW